jgi:hypothetical protein
MSFVSEILYGADTFFHFVLLAFLLRGPFRKYTVFTIYILGESAADVIEYFAYNRLGWESSAYRRLYWTDHVTLDLSLFLVVIAFTYAALQGNRLRPAAAKALGVIVVVALALPFTILRDHYGPRHGSFTSQWFNHASQIWNFGAAIMNLVLWTALLSNRRRDPQLVTLSIGVGIATTSAAIAWGARRWLSPENRWPVDIFMAVAGLASLLLWCWVFRPKAAGHSSSTTPPSGGSPPTNVSPLTSVSPPTSAPPPGALTSTS